MNDKFTNLFLKNMFILDDAYGFSSHNTTIKYSALVSTLKNVELTPSIIAENLHSIKIFFDEDSPFRKAHSLILATLLNIDSSISLKNINSTFSNLESVFTTNTFLALSSEVLNLHSGTYKLSELVNKLKCTYDIFKKQHWFITGPEDISICALFSVMFEDTLIAITQTEKCYNYLQNIKFFKGSHLQSLSQALVFSKLSIDECCLSSVKLQGLFEQHNYIIKNEALPILGFASIVTNDFEGFIKSFIYTYDLLSNDTLFNTYRINEETKYIITLSLTILEFTNDPKLLDPLVVFLLNICTHKTNSFSENISNKLFLD